MRTSAPQWRFFCPRRIISLPVTAISFPDEEATKQRKGPGNVLQPPPKSQKRRHPLPPSNNCCLFATVKILLIHQHFKDPRLGGAVRSYYLSRALVAAGHQVVVLSGYNGTESRHDVIKGIDVYWLPVPYDNRFGFKARSKSFAWFVIQVIRSSRVFRDADLCYAISVPLTTGLAALWIKRRFGIPYVFEVGDLWPDAPIQLGFITNPILKKFLYLLEKRIYRSALRIVALSAPIESEVGKRTTNADIHIIPNLADTCFYQPTLKDKARERALGVEGKFVVSYIGALGFANGLDQILSCAKASLVSNLNMVFLICGDGAMKEELHRLRNANGLDNVMFLPFCNREGVRDILSVTDAAFVSYRPVPILQTGSPNKYFDGLSAGKLIVVNFSGWIREEIEHAKCGIYVSPHDPESFVAAIRPFANDPGLLKQYQLAARRLAERKYSRKELGDQFVRAIAG